MLQFAKLIDFSKRHTLQLMDATAALFPLFVCVFVCVVFFFIEQEIPFSAHCLVELVKCQVRLDFYKSENKSEFTSKRS